MSAQNDHDTYGGLITHVLENETSISEKTRDFVESLGNFLDSNLYLTSPQKTKLREIGRQLRLDLTYFNISNVD